GSPRRARRARRRRGRAGRPARSRVPGPSGRSRYCPNPVAGRSAPTLHAMSDMRIDGHAGQQAVAALQAFGSDVMFTLNGGHIWPLYEAARDRGIRIVDTRHEQTATFAAEGWAKLTRRPGVAA